MGRWLLALLLAPAALSAAPPLYPPVPREAPVDLARDRGAHPDFRTEWWYVTGWLSDADGKPLGFQVTFFRSRPELDQANPSAFAPKQLLFAHAALADPAAGRLRHDQRAARAGFGLAQARVGETDVAIDDWTLRRDGDGAYLAHVVAADFTLDLRLTPTQPPLLEGDRGFSRKGPAPAQASAYYSEPQLAATGSINRDGRRLAVSGRAWLDHEWSSTLLAADAVGWDWLGINLDDSGALMAFRIRDGAGHTLWSEASWRRADGSEQRFAAGAVAFRPQRRWRSPRTGADYPVAMAVALDGVTFTLTPLMDDQELDSRATTGAVYWEGAVTAERDGRIVGRGYLELTGYLVPLKM